MDRAEHLAWAKERGLAYLPSDPVQATTSFISDLRKHPELAGHGVQELIAMHMFSDLLDERTARELIAGTN